MMILLIAIPAASHPPSFANNRTTLPKSYRKRTCFSLNYEHRIKPVSLKTNEFLKTTLKTLEDGANSSSGTRKAISFPQFYPSQAGREYFAGNGRQENEGGRELQGVRGTKMASPSPVLRGTGVPPRQPQLKPLNGRTKGMKFSLIMDNTSGYCLSHYCL